MKIKRMIKIEMKIAIIMMMMRVMVITTIIITS